MEKQASVIWLFGLSGAGKSTLAARLADGLAVTGRAPVLLDGDRLRGGLNRDLGFTESDRSENLRRAGEVARLLVDQGVTVIAAFITPLRRHRAVVAEIVGRDKFVGIYLTASYEVCSRRDPKGLYRKAANNQISQFSGKDSIFEPPLTDEDIFCINTSDIAVTESARRLWAYIEPKIRRSLPA